MVSRLLLLCVLATGQVPYPSVPKAPSRPEWDIRPQLTVGQELVYSGTWKEETATELTPSSRAYRLETRVLALEAPRSTIPVVLFTVLKTIDRHSTSGGQISSVRLEKASIGPRGEMTVAPSVHLSVPLDGPPTLELGAFVELPAGHLTLDQSWFASERGQPDRLWRVVGVDMANGTSCVKLVGEQKSADWDQPRVDHVAWRRRDTVWLSPRTGFANRVERVIEVREPGRSEPSRRQELRCELETGTAYSGQFLEDRRQEITLALSASEKATPLLPAQARNGAQLDAVLRQIAYHVGHQPPTPYREAVLEVRRRIEAAKRGEVPIALPGETPAEIATNTGVATIGAQAPDFVVPDIRANRATNLKPWLGKPILLVFFQPDSITLDPLLRFAQSLADANADKLAVIGMAMTDDAEQVKRLAHTLQLTMPLLNGSGLRQSYVREGTPTMVLIDGTGVVRGSFLGWGNEVPHEVLAELRRWLPER